MSATRAHGVVYTPPQIARFLVRDALGEVPSTGVRLLDPACGDGALLVEAFDQLLALRVAAGQSRRAAARATLTENLFGIDIDPAAVAATRRALCARAGIDLPLATTLRLGDALLGPPPGRFDCIVANPPYVRIQRNSGQAAALKAAYSACTGSFDLYLAFIERCLSLLSAGGRAALIAPRAWLVNEYGRGLRRVVGERRALRRWIDLGDHQAFADATTYTALMLFTAEPNDDVQHASAADGAFEDVRWERTPWDELDPASAWHLLPGPQRALVRRLAARHPTLSDVTEAIVVGIQTSADDLYHLERLGPDAYRSRAGDDVRIEDALMRPLVSGRHVARYRIEPPRTHLLFPYDLSSAPRLFTATELAARFPGGWAWLCRHEQVLRARERGKMDRDDRWWAYNYPKNLARQTRRKVLVPRLVKRLCCAVDEAGELFMDNVDVGGVLPHDPADLWWLAAVLNGPVAHFVWRRHTRPFRGGYLAANKQFIASLPVPQATAADRRVVSDLARSGHHEAANAALAALYRLDPDEQSLVSADFGDSSPQG